MSVAQRQSFLIHWLTLQETNICSFTSTVLCHHPESSPTCLQQLLFTFIFYFIRLNQVQAF